MKMTELLPKKTIDKIKLVCKIFPVKKVIIDNVPYEPPKGKDEMPTL